MREHTNIKVRQLLEGRLDEVHPAIAAGIASLAGAAGYGAYKGYKALRKLAQKKADAKEIERIIKDPKTIKRAAAWHKAEIADAGYIDGILRNAISFKDPRMIDDIVYYLEDPEHTRKKIRVDVTKHDVLKKRDWFTESLISALAERDLISFKRVPLDKAKEHATRYVNKASFAAEHNAKGRWILNHIAWAPEHGPSGSLVMTFMDAATGRRMVLAFSSVGAIMSLVDQTAWRNAPQFKGDPVSETGVYIFSRPTVTRNWLEKATGRLIDLWEE